MAGISLDGGFDSPFQEQVDFFRAKLNLPTASWDDIWQSAHDRSFVVAGAMKADLLNDLRQAVDKAISTGTSLETFRNDFQSIVARRGWTGWSGEGSEAGFNWRTKVIYETNLRSSYAAGRWAQLTDPKFQQLMPFWEYVHSDSVLHPRPLHLAWNHLTLPCTHPFWKTHFPPNGWGCRCRIVARFKPLDNAITIPREDWMRIDEKTGAPIGIDRGWAYAPGASLKDELGTMVAQKVKSLPDPLAKSLRNAVAPIVSSTPATVDEFIAAGRKITNALPDGAMDPGACRDALISRLAAEVGIDKACAVTSRGAGANLVKEASRLFPDSWTAAADQLGPLYVKSKSNARGWQYTFSHEPALPGGRAKLPDYGIVPVQKGVGYMVVRPNAIENAVHEYAHRLQAALPELDDLFQQLHTQRTAGDKLESLKALTGLGYRPDELTRKDSYVEYYQGKDYSGKALEVMTMAMEHILGSKNRLHNFAKVYNGDRSMFDFVVGLLFYWKP